jgi:hypothetical protein
MSDCNTLGYSRTAVADFDGVVVFAKGRKDVFTAKFVVVSYHISENHMAVQILDPYGYTFLSLFCVNCLCRPGFYTSGILFYALAFGVKGAAK